MWSPRQVTHLPPVWDLLLPLAKTPDRRDQRLIVSHPKDTEIHNLVFTPNNSGILARGSNPGRPRDKLAS